MSLVISERQALAASRAALSPARLERLSMQIHHAVAAASGADYDAQLNDLIREAIYAFIDTDADAHRAAERVSPLLESIGRRQARRGDDAAALGASFLVARRAMQRGLTFGLGNAITGDIVVRLREELMTYLGLLFSHARYGLEYEQQFGHSLTKARRRRYPREDVDAGLDHGQQVALRQLSPTDRIHVICSVEHPLPAKLCRQAGVAANAARRLAIVPTTWTTEHLVKHFTEQAVIGPAVTKDDAADSASLARRAARLLAEGSVTDPRPLVPVEDLLGTLLLNGEPLLGALLADKHLEGLAAMSPTRRLAAAEFLLLWLERAQPTNQLARELGIPPQTAHSRIKTLRHVLGDTLDDPSLRLELIVALRQVLPRWRVEATHAEPE